MVVLFLGSVLPAPGTGESTVRCITHIGDLTVEADRWIRQRLWL
jgi:hypothetical protein